MIYRLSQIFLLAALATTFVGCSSYNVDDVLPDKAVEYKREKQAERNLEIPPDLTSDRITDRMSVPDNLPGESTSYSEYVTDREVRGVDPANQSSQANSTNRSAANGEVAANIGNMEVRRDGDARWLLIDAPADAVWQKVIDFWQENGILLVEQDPTLGVMRTGWLENRANISRDIVTDTIRKVFDGLYEAGTRDQYRVRLERTDNNETELYLTHYGMEEQVLQGSDGSVERTVWAPRARDPDLENEMLRRLMVYMGASDARAKAQLAAQGQREHQRSQLLKTAQGTQLMIDDSFSRSWRLVGLALDRVGFAVEDRDRSAGIYYVRYNDPSKDSSGEKKGWLSSLAFWSNDDDVDKQARYQVRVGSSGLQTVVTVANEQGEADSSPTAIRILTLLQEQIR